MGCAVIFRFKDLTEQQKSFFANGLGPEWLPGWILTLFTQQGSWFFAEASWRHHDFGYARGFTWRHRLVCDWKFFRAMSRDAMSQDVPLKIPIALALSSLFFAAVVLFGWSSFHFGDRYRTLDEIIPGTCAIP